MKSTGFFHCFFSSRFLGLVVLSTIFSSCDQTAKNEYAVNGTLKNTPATTVYLEENSLDAAQPVIVDSATIQKDGSYHLSTVPKEETIYSLRLDDNRFPFVSFVNDSKAIGIDADFKNTEDPYTIKGSAGSVALKNFLYELGKKVDALQQARYAGDSIGFRRSQRDSIIYTINTHRTAVIQDLKKYASGFIGNGSSVPLVLYALGTYQSIASNPAYAVEPFTDAEVQTILNNASKKFPQHKALATIQQQLLHKSLANQTLAPDFTLPDTTGQLVSLAQFRGKYVLVDFWASWCPPCRAENPNIVAAYQKFKDKNFAVLGVSLDKERAPWLKAIADDSLSWTHVSDLKYWDSQVVPLYHIEEIPFNVLLDPKGIIIGQSLRGPALQQKLSQVLR